LPDEIIENHKTITIPMKENSRSINLANSVGIVVFESLRQANVK
jgi:tRNA (cytidine/uridine-2'-O-)-methyltransferase